MALRRQTLMYDPAPALEVLAVPSKLHVPRSVTLFRTPLLATMGYCYCYWYWFCYQRVGKPNARGHRAYTQGVCSHICGAYNSLQPITDITASTPCSMEYAQ